MTGDDAETPCHLVTVVTLEILVEGEVVAADAASHHGRMRSEHGGHGNARILNIKETGTRLPLMELGHHLVGGIEVEIVETDDHPSGGIAEECRLLVIPVTGQRIDSETFPVLGENLVLLGQELLVVHKDGYRLSGDVPAADADADALLGGLEFPVAIQ